MEVNRVNEGNKKRLFSISREFTEILKKYLQTKLVTNYKLMKTETKMFILFKVKEIVSYSVLSRSELKRSIVSLTSYVYLLSLAIART